MADILPDSLHIPAFARVTDYVGVWAIEQLAANALLAHAKNIDLRQHVADASTQPKAELRSTAEMMPDGRGKSVAVIRVQGTLMKASSSLGGTGTVQMRRDIRKAAADADTSAIMLVIDSPGGTVAGTSDLSDEVRAATKKKPVYAFVQDLCASAAYWVASQADKIYANSDTAMIGSIGTFMSLMDMSKYAEKEGIEAVVFATGTLKGAGTPGTAVTEEQRAHFQAIVDQSQKSFDAAVKQGRGMTDKQLSAVRSGGVFLAQEAISNGLIDDIQPFESAFADLVKESRSPSRAKASAELPRGVPMSVETAEPVALVPDHVATMRKQAADEQARISAIQKLCAKTPDIAGKAIAEGWSVEKAELTSMKASLPTGIQAMNPHAAGPHFTGVGSSTVEAQVIEAALCLNLGMSEKFVSSKIGADRERVMNAAADQRYRGYGLHSLMGQVIQSAGHQYHGSFKSDDFIRAAKRADMALQASSGGFSTVSLSGILSNVANKGLIESYSAVEVVWNQFCAVRNHPDFKTVTNYRLDSTGAFKKVGPDGELKNVGLSEAPYTNRVETYGAIIALTRQQMVNDDLGAFLEIPRLVGRMSALRVEEAVFVTLLSNPATFFSVGNRNLITGAGSALSLSALTTAEATFANQVDSNGKPVLVSPKVLLVPTVLKATAESIFKNDKIQITGSTDRTTTDDNPHVGKFRPVSSPYLNNTNLRDQDAAAISGQSSTGYYLFADPGVRAAIAVAFLNGQQTPTIQSDETTFNTLGMQWRGYHDFGVGMEDTNAAQRNAGA